MDSNNLQEPLLQNDWRAQDARERIVNKIMEEMLKRHLPFFTGQEGLQELKKIAVRFEEKMHSEATSEFDYLTKISLKMLKMETKHPNPMANSLQSNAASSSKNVQEPASQSVQSQMQNPGQHNVPSTGVPNSAGSTSALPPLDAKSQGTMPGVPLQNPNMQNTFNTNPFALSHPMMQAWPMNSLLQFQSQSQRDMPHFQLGTNLKSKKKALTSLKKMHALQQLNEGQVKPQMQPMMMPTQQHNPFSSISSVSNTRQNMPGALQSSSNIDHGQVNVLNQTQQVSLQQNLVGGSQQNGLTALQSNSKLLQPQQINPVQQMFSTQQPMQQYQQQQMLLQYVLRQQLIQQQQQQLIKQLSQKQSAQQLIALQQQASQKESVPEQVSSNALQQNSVGGFQPMTSCISTQNGLTALQSNANSLQSNPNVLQPQEQQMFSTHQLLQQHQQILQQYVLRQQQAMQLLSEKQSVQQQLVREQEQTSQKKSEQQQTSQKKSEQQQTSQEQSAQQQICKKQSRQDLIEGYFVLGCYAVLVFVMMMLIHFP